MSYWVNIKGEIEMSDWLHNENQKVGYVFDEEDLPRGSEGRLKYAWIHRIDRDTQKDSTLYLNGSLRDVYDEGGFELWLRKLLDDNHLKVDEFKITVKTMSKIIVYELDEFEDHEPIITKTVSHAPDIFR